MSRPIIKPIESKTDAKYASRLESAHKRIEVLNETRNKVIAERDALQKKLNDLQFLLSELRSNILPDRPFPSP